MSRVQQGGPFLPEGLNEGVFLYPCELRHLYFLAVSWEDLHVSPAVGITLPLFPELPSSICALQPAPKSAGSPVLQKQSCMDAIPENRRESTFRGAWGKGEGQTTQLLN